jgi:hypothetical protein
MSFVSFNMCIYIHTIGMHAFGNTKHTKDFSCRFWIDNCILFKNPVHIWFWRANVTLSDHNNTHTQKKPAQSRDSMANNSWTSCGMHSEKMRAVAANISCSCSCRFSSQILHAVKASLDKGTNCKQ